MGPQQRVVQPVAQQGPVGQTGEAVVERLVLHFPEQSVVVRDVAETPHSADDLAFDLPG
jgi:hypothetical protein